MRSLDLESLGLARFVEVSVGLPLDASSGFSSSLQLVKTSVKAVNKVRMYEKFFMGLV